MKRYGDLFHDVCSMPNLVLAHQNASRGKRHYVEVRMVNSDPEKYLSDIQAMITGKTYRTAPYKEMKKNDYGKPRKIHRLPYYPDRIVHHAIVQVVSQIWQRTLIRDTYACIPRRGIHDGLRRIQDALTADPDGTKYCLKMDVKSFYHSLDHAILKQIIRRKIKDKHLLALVDEIIDSFSPGVPIGNYLSQFFGNLYLSGYDHWMKEVHRCRYYFRYCDDVVILGGDKARLHALREITDRFWAEKRNLRLKGNWQVFPVDVRGIDFLGYRFFRNYTLLRKSIAKKFKRKMRHVKEHHARMRPISVMSTISSYGGWMKHANCMNLRNRHIDAEVQRILAQSLSENKKPTPAEKVGKNEPGEFKRCEAEAVL